MAAGVLDRVPVDQINERAAAMRPGRFALTLIAAPLIALGWLTAVGFAWAWKGGRWVTAAFLVGWTTAHGPTKSQQIAAQKATIEAQAMRLSRFEG